MILRPCGMTVMFNDRLFPASYLFLRNPPFSSGSPFGMRGLLSLGLMTLALSAIFLALINIPTNWAGEFSFALG